MVLLGVIVLAVASVDITSRRFFGTSKEESWIQDEAKVAMEDIVKNIQLGIGDMSNARNMGDDPYDGLGCSRGFYILVGGVLAISGSQIQVKQDTDRDGAIDRTIEYTYQGGPDYKIVFDPDITNAGDEEDLAEGIVTSAIFNFDNVTPIPNRVEVAITVRRNPTEAKSLDNPETTLTSSIILRAMSTN